MRVEPSWAGLVVPYEKEAPESLSTFNHVQPQQVVCNLEWGPHRTGLAL